MHWFFFGMDGIFIGCVRISIVLLCCGSDFHPLTFLNSIRGQLVVEVEFWLFKK